MACLRLAAGKRSVFRASARIRRYRFRPPMPGAWLQQAGTVGAGTDFPKITILAMRQAAARSRFRIGCRERCAAVASQGCARRCRQCHAGRSADTLPESWRASWHSLSDRRAAGQIRRPGDGANRDSATARAARPASAMRAREAAFRRAQQAFAPGAVPQVRAARRRRSLIAGSFAAYSFISVPGIGVVRRHGIGLCRRQAGHGQSQAGRLHQGQPALFDDRRRAPCRISTSSGIIDLEGIDAKMPVERQGVRARSAPSAASTTARTTRSTFRAPSPSPPPTA